MQTFTKIQLLQKQLTFDKESGKTIAFVPTMGALHQGHISLVKMAKEKCDVVIVSIFVNPTQFNNKEDLLHYPRNEQIDKELLKKVACDYVFIPEVEEIYPNDYTKTVIDLGNLDKVMEGQFRPGHFEGVVNVVARLFDIVKPDIAIFGRKDFQQVAVIKEMVKQLKLSVEIVVGPIVRSVEGLALSSRNIRLSEKEKAQALILSQTLELGKECTANETPNMVLKIMKENFMKGALQLEYLQIVHPDTLENLDKVWVKGATACIAAYCGQVRLIDNLELIPLH